MYGFLIVVWLIVGPLGGYAIGNSKGRGAFGIASGLALGPLLGWLLVGLMEPSLEVLEARRRALAYEIAHPPATKPLAAHQTTGLAAPTPTAIPAKWVDASQTAMLKDALETAGVAPRDARRILDSFAHVRDGDVLLPLLISATNAGGEPAAIAESVKRLVDDAPKFTL